MRSVGDLANRLETEPLVADRLSRVLRRSREPTDRPDLLGPEASPVVGDQQGRVGENEPNPALPARVRRSVVRVLQELERVAARVLLANQLLSRAPLVQRLEDMISSAGLDVGREGRQFIPPQSIDELGCRHLVLVQPPTHALILRSTCDPNLGCERQGRPFGAPAWCFGEWVGRESPAWSSGRQEGPPWVPAEVGPWRRRWLGRAISWRAGSGGPLGGWSGRGGT